MRRRTIQLAKTDPRASHLAISQGVGSIHAPFSRSLYTIRIQGCTPSQANIYIYIYTVRYEGKKEEGVERNVRTRHISKSVRSNLSRFDDGESKLPQIETEDERIERSEWMGLKGYERASNREKLSRIARTLGRVISEYRRGEVGSRASERAGRGFDPSSIKILSIFRADPGDQTQFQSTSPGREALNTSGASRRDVMELMGKLWMGPRNSSCLAYKER